MELYGFSRARMVILLGFAANLFVSLLLQIGIILPGAESWTGQEAMAMIFGAVPRILAASFTAFLCGSLVNAWVMARMKAASPDGRRFSVRAIVSTLWGEGTDSIIFFPVAFAGVLPAREIISLIVTQTLLKTAYECAVLPVTVRVVRSLKKIEDRATATD